MLRGAFRSPMLCRRSIVDKAGAVRITAGRMRLA